MIVTRKEIEKARLAQEFIRNAAYPRESEAVRIIHDRNVQNVPVSAHDVRNSFDIYGPTPEMVRGKMVERKRGSEYALIDKYLKEERKSRILHSEVMHIDS